MDKAGYLVLEGGAEFGGRMEEPDRRALALAGGLDALVTIIPTAAAPDQNHRRAGNNARRWFEKLGAQRIEVAEIIDPASANLGANADLLRQSKMIYLLGGFTHYLGQTLRGSAAWDACLAAYQDGAVIAGSSAGAMVMCAVYFNPEEGRVEPGLGLVENACVLPHHNTFGKNWVGRLRKLLPEICLLGIDERTGMIDDGEEGGKRTWTVYGQGAVTIYHPDGIEIYQSRTNFNFLAWIKKIEPGKPQAKWVNSSNRKDRGCRMVDKIKVNRAPVMTLWAAVVAERLGFDPNEALTLGKVVTGLNAQAKGQRLGIYDRPDEDAVRAAREKQPEEQYSVGLMGRAVPVVNTKDGVRAVNDGRPENPASVQRYLENKFGDALPEVRAAMQDLAGSLAKEDLKRRAFEIYETFRPSIPEGKRGWGAAGELDLDKIRSLKKG